MKLKDEHISEIMQMDLEEAYKAYRVLCLEEPKLKKEYQKIRFGIRYEFDIYEVFEGNIIYKPKWDEVIIGKKIRITTQEFRGELEEREAIMKKLIIDNITEEDIIKPR